MNLRFLLLLGLAGSCACARDFPAVSATRQVKGDLVEADFIHRRGQFRAEGSGELVNFSLQPYAVVRHLNTEVDLRDVPLGAHCTFAMLPDATVAALQTDGPEDPEVTEGLRKKHQAFLKFRGLAGWIDKVEGRKLTITFFGDPEATHALFKDENVDPNRAVKAHQRVAVAVANDELRTYNPPVDNKRGEVLEVQAASTDNYGCSGERWVIEPDLLLEGFRKDSVVRVFVHPGWPMEDMPFGEGLYSEVFGVNPTGPAPNQFPFRTDFGNAHLPWYQLKPGELPPVLSEHRVNGELLSVEAATRSGQFRTDRTGEMVNFSLLPCASVMALNAEANFSDLEIGTRCQFFLHPDGSGAFTKASVITDEFTRMANDKLTYRLNDAKLDDGRLFVAWKVPPIENDRSRMEQPPDYGQCELTVDAATRIWKGDQPAKLTDLAKGDDLLVNITGCTMTSRGRVTDIWVGTETHKSASTRQLIKHNALLKTQGLPAWVERQEGNRVTLTLINGPRRNEFKQLFDDNFKPGQEVKFALADETLHPTSDGTTARLTDNQNIPLATYGCSGTRIVLEPMKPLDGLRPGSLMLVFAPGWRD